MGTRVCFLALGLGAACFSLESLAQSGCYPGLPCLETAVPRPSTPPPPPPVPRGTLTQADLSSLFNRYIAAWREGRVEDQAALLSSDFYYSDERGAPTGVQGRAAYLEQKRTLARVNDWIEITTRDVSYNVQGDRGTITYFQRYNNPKYCSGGRNVFHVRKEAATAKIFREEFNASKRVTKPAAGRSCPV